MVTVPMQSDDKTVGAFDAKTHLSELLERVRQGERITITRRGVPVAVLVPPADEARRGVEAAIAELTALRERTREGSETIRQLRDEGRRR
jgi:prevent-host-death family protein